MTAWGHRRAWRGIARERGAVALEFALVLPVLVMLLLGVTTMGLTYSHHLALTNAVREGARIGAALPYDPASPGTWATSVQTRVIETYFDAGGVDPSQVCVQLTDAGGTAISGAQTASVTSGSCGTAPSTPTALPSATPSPGPATSNCAVKVWARQPQTVILGVLPNLPITIGASSVALYGRTVGSCVTP